MNKSILKAGKTIAAYFSASAIPLALNLVANPFIAMNMSPKDFAITGYFTSFCSLLTPLINFYFLQYYIKRFYECNAEQRLILKAAIYKLLIVYSFMATILCFIGVWAYIKLFNSTIEFELYPYLPLALFGIPLTGIYSLELADYKMQKNSHSYFCLSVITGVLNTIAVVLMVVFLKMAAFGKLLAPFIIHLVVFLYLFIKHRDLWKVNVSWSYIFAMFKFCWPLATAAMLGFFTNGFDKTYLESVGNVTEYGYYCVAASIAAYLHVFSGAISNTFQPDVYEAIATHNNRRLLKVFVVQLSMLFVLVLVFIIVCPYLIYLLTAGRYMESTSYTRIISIATVTSAMYFNINCFTIAKGHPQLSMWTSIIGSGLIILSMWFAVKNWTFVGGAWMASISYVIFFFVNVMLLVCVSDVHRMSNFIKSLKK